MSNQNLHVFQGSMHGRPTQLDSSDYEDRMKMKETKPKNHRHKLVHNFSSSEINDGVYITACSTKFYFNVLIYFPVVPVLHTCTLLMKEMTDKQFKCTLDDRTDDRSDSMQMIPEWGSKHGCCIDQTALEHNLHVRRTIRRRIIEQGRPMPLAFRILPKMIVHLNCTKGGVDEHPRFLKS